VLCLANGAYHRPDLVTRGARDEPHHDCVEPLGRRIGHGLHVRVITRHALREPTLATVNGCHTVFNDFRERNEHLTLSRINRGRGIQKCADSGQSPSRSDRCSLMRTMSYEVC